MSRRAILPWVWYSIVLTLTFVPLVWLTQKVIHLDDAQREAMRKFDQEERVGRALWRMDVKLMPLLAQEAMWSEESFQPLVQAGITGGGKGVTTQQLSPLLANPLPDHVLMYFELEGDQPLRSPLVPQGKSRDVVLRASVPLETVKKAEGRLAELQQQIDRKALIAQLPAIPTETELATLLNLPGQELGYQNMNSAIVGNNYILPEGGENLTRGITQGNGNNTDPQGSQNGSGPFLNGPSQREGINIDNQNGLATNNGRMAKSRKGAFEDLENRNAVYQAITQKKGTDRRGMEEVVAKESIRSSAWQPVWMDKVLILARQVKQGERHWVQGVWLNWQYLQDELRAEVDDLQLPPFAFQAAQLSIESSHPHLLATLPVEMVLDEKSGQGGLWNSALRWSLVVAWMGILAASVAAGVVLQGVTALSERRAAFVSAVTHELRTPLTTFRMYAEMLAENMVSSDEQRQAYAGTLKTEADRLAHLVENVLEYAQLERGKNKARREPIRMESLMERIEPRLRERAGQAGLELAIVWESEKLKESILLTDPVAVEQILFNLVDNSCKYGRGESEAEVRISIRACDGKNIALFVKDYGPGISVAQQRRLFQPFSKSAEEAAASAPGVGLGLALCKRVATALGGKLELVSTGPQGTEFQLRLPC